MPDFENHLPEITEFCKKFDTSSYNSRTELFVHYLHDLVSKFERMMSGRDLKIQSLMRENGELRKRLSECKN